MKSVVEAASYDPINCRLICLQNFCLNSTQKISDQKSNEYTSTLQSAFNSMDQSPSWKACSHSTSQEITRLLRNPEASLPCSEKLATRPYPEPVMIHNLTPYSLTIILILSSHLRKGLPNVQTINYIPKHPAVCLFQPTIMGHKWRTCMPFKYHVFA